MYFSNWPIDPDVSIIAKITALVSKFGRVSQVLNRRSSGVIFKRLSFSIFFEKACRLILSSNVRFCQHLPLILSYVRH